MGCEPIIDGKPASQAAIDALDWKNSVRVATTAVLPANSFASNRLTGDANGALAAQDGVTLVVDEDLLVKNEVAGADNGIYVLIQVGTAGTPYILQRRADANTSAEVTSGMTVPVEEGTINDNTAWTLTTAQPITLNTTALVFQNIISLLQGLNSVLGVGNTSGGTDIQMTAGDQILMEGAATADAPAGMDSIIIGDGAGVEGLTIFTSTTTTGTLAFTDASGVEQASLAYDHNVPQFQWTVETALEMFLTATELSPAADGGLSLGITGVRWATVFAGDAVLAGAVIANGVAGANDLVIGDGSVGVDSGITIFTGPAEQGTIEFNDVSAVASGAIAYEHTFNAFRITTNGTDRMVWDTVAIRPNTAGVYDLGTPTAAWGELHVTEGFFAGADTGDGPAGATNLIIGDGTAAVGLTIFSTTTTEGTIVFTDGAGVEQASIVYDHNAPQFAWTVETSLEMLLTTVALSPGADAGSSLGTDPLRWLEGFIDQVLVAGAVASDAAAGADDVVIGDGTGDAGQTFFISATTQAEIAAAVGANDQDGLIQYDANVSPRRWIFSVDNAAVYTMHTNAFFPTNNLTQDLGGGSNRFADVFQGRSIYGVEASGATITVGVNGRIMADASAANVDVDLPNAAEGLDYQIIVTDVTNGVDVTPQALDDINGAGAGVVVVISVVGRYFITAEDATNWHLHGPVAVT